MSLEAIVYQGLIGLSTAMYLWLVAAGLTIAFGVLGVLNFAHGSLYMVGAYLAYTFYGKLGWPFWLSLPLAIVGVAALGALIERFFFRSIYHLDIAYQLLLTFGFVLIFADATKMIWGGVAQIPQMPELFDGTVSIAGRPFPRYSLVVIAIGVAVAGGLWLLLERTLWGRTVRAAASDREMTGALGVNIPLLYTGVFAFAAGLAALGGALITPVRVVTPGMASQVIVDVFIITVIGGLGNLGGAFLGALIVGLMQSYGALFFPNAYLFLIYLIMALVLLFRPRGLLGRN